MGYAEGFVLCNDKDGNNSFNYVSSTHSAPWLRCSATNRKVAGSIPDVVIGIFH